ncbi:MAG: IS4 family transposase [Chloroflexi bacterium]|nr:MAG: IS4 family transposase [Chloroflexota bacterium]
MSINSLYSTWKKKMEQQRPHEHRARVNILVWLIVGIYASRSVQLGRIAAKIPGSACRTSVMRRLERLVNNKHLRVREWYEPLIRPLLQAQAGREYRLVVDGSKVGPWHQLLLVGLAYRRRVIPLGWMWVRTPRHKGRSSAARQLALLGEVRCLLPPDAQVLLVGDQEFGAVEVLRQLDAWGWGYVLRQKSSQLFRATAQDPWQAFGTVIDQPGQTVWLGKVDYTEQQAYRTNLLAVWQLGEKQPWLLATNLPTLQVAVKAYRRRMWIDETFGDLKDNGFDLEATRLQTIQHLQRLTLAVMLLYLDLLVSGARAIKDGLRHLVDRADRRDLSLFRIGLYLRERLLANQQPFRIHFLPRLC